MTKALKKLENDGMYLNIRKAIYEKTCSQYHTKWAKWKLFPLKSGMRQECSFSPMLFDIVL
jgi:hypothetical protein